MSILLEKFYETIKAVVPTLAIVLLIHFFITPLPTESLISFIVGMVVVLFGLTIFLTGIDIAISPIGEHLGRGIAKSNKLSIVIIGGLVLGFLISAAEPSLVVLGDQIATVTEGAVSSTTIVMIVSAGLAIMIAIGLMRIVYGWSLVHVLTIAYGLIFILALFTSSEFLAISFDSSGATTGAITVPFMLALSAGIASLKRDTKTSGEDSFGLVAIASSGAIIAVMLFNIFSPIDGLEGSLDISVGSQGGLLQNFINAFTTQLLEVAIMLAPVIVIFFLYQTFKLKLPKRRVNRIWFGSLYVYIGLVLFLTGVNAGYMDVGSLIGYELATSEMYIELILVGLALGVATILAEPAVSVLTNQIEDVTAGGIHRIPVLISLCVGVGLAIVLSVIRVIYPGLELWYILLPGYLLAIALSYYVPKVFVGIAFDAGGTATGPITATFILAFIQGAAEGAPQASVVSEGFGMIALVALMPILTLQILGVIYKFQNKN